MQYASGLTDEGPRDLGTQIAEMTTEDAVAFMKQLGSTDSGVEEVVIRVPDFDHAVALYSAQSAGAEQACIAGGKFKSIWNRQKLMRLLDSTGWAVTGPHVGTSWVNDGMIVIRARRYWRPEPRRPMRDVQAIMSLPRIAWTTTMGCLHESCASLGIDAQRATGVFWGQCLERMMNTAKADGHKYILTVDYDSVFDANDIVRLWQIMETNPSVDVLCPMQIQRDKENAIVCLMGSDGRLASGICEDKLQCEAIDIHTGHFGLTMIRASSLDGVRRPLFWGQPAPDGTWGDGRTDDDIHFWNVMREAGRRVCLTPRVRIGHLQLVVTWPDESYAAIHQYHPDYIRDGRPTCTMTF